LLLNCAQFDREDIVHTRPFVAACAVSICVATSAIAQAPRHEISLGGGISQFDASGTGTAPVGVLRISAPLVGNWILADLGFLYASMEEQLSAVNTRVGIAEGQVQLQIPMRAVRPYVGLGGGWLHYFNNDAGSAATVTTVSGSLGLRVPVSRKVLFRGELRLRAWESRGGGGYNNSAAEITAGLGFAF
jgi:hypothetical protein